MVTCQTRSKKSVTVSIQGVFILLFHVVLNDKAKQELLRHLKSTKSEVKVMTHLNNCRSSY